MVRKIFKFVIKIIFKNNVKIIKTYILKANQIMKNLTCLLRIYMLIINNNKFNKTFFKDSLVMIN